MNGFKGYTQPLYIGMPEVRSAIIVPMCEICGIARAKKVHTRCSKLKQQIFRRDNERV
jgi:hypothetical protein